MGTRRADKFRQAAMAYRIYGIIYLAGALVLASVGLGPRGSERYGLAWWLVFWFVIGALFIGLFPWLIARGPRGPWYLWFTRLLALFVFVRAIGVAHVAWAPTVATVPLPGGGAIPMALGAAAFALIALGTAYLVARAGWDWPP